MYVASDYELGVVLEQKKDNKPYAIYYASWTFDETQVNYGTMEKEYLIVIFALKKFRLYLINSRVIVFTDHTTYKHLLKKSNLKPCLYSMDSSPPRV